MMDYRNVQKLSFAVFLVLAQFLISGTLSSPTPTDIDMDSLRESIALMSERQDIPGMAKNTTSQSSSMTSLFSRCVRLCSGNKDSVAALHSCHRECMVDPHKYDNQRDSESDTDHQSQSDQLSSDQSKILSNLFLTDDGIIG